MVGNLKKIILMLCMFSAAGAAHAENTAKWDDWKMRTELAIDAEANRKPFYYLETVLPFYRSSDKEKVLFTQLRVSDLDRFTERRNVVNLGLGYRHALADNTAMAGIKLFYDVESKYNMSRWSLGGDLSWKALDLYANQYSGLNDWTPTNEGATEKSLNGYDVDLAAQIPFMPWVKAHYMYYQWNKVLAADNVIGNKVSLEGALSLNWTVEMGRNTDNVVANDNFMLLRYRWAGFVREHHNAANNFWSSSAFEMRDMRDFTLEHMRRSNTIAVERIAP